MKGQRLSGSERDSQENSEQIRRTAANTFLNFGLFFGGMAVCTDKKENKIFLIYKDIQKGAVAKSYMTNGLLIHIWLNICAFPYILGSPSSSMTLQPILI
jgi:hypothetical protein